MEQVDKFTKGIFFNEKPNAPEFVLMGLAIPNVKEFSEWMLSKADENGTLKFDVKRSKGGKIYGYIDTWRPDGQKQTKSESSEKVEEDLPF